jgi:hypothetical protein
MAPEPLQPLLDLPELQRLIDFGGISLDADLIRAYCGTADTG